MIMSLVPLVILQHLISTVKDLSPLVRIIGSLDFDKAWVFEMTQQDLLQNGGKGKDENSQEYQGREESPVLIYLYKG